ncbi:MAG: hypothetical protein AAF532_13610 [Planctomycetota bacterium]
MNAPAADSPDLLVTLADLERRCDDLAALQDTQSAALAAGDYAAVLDVATRRDAVLSGLSGPASPRAVRENWPAWTAALPAADRGRANDRLRQIEGRIADLLARQERDLAAATTARDETFAALASVREAGDVHSAYRDHLGQSSSRRLDLDG